MPQSFRKFLISMSVTPLKAVRMLFVSVAQVR